MNLLTQMLQVHMKVNMNQVIKDDVRIVCGFLPPPTLTTLPSRILLWLP